MTEWEWYDDHNTTRLFIHLLLKANHKPKKWRGIMIGEGEFLTGLNSLSLQTGLSVRQIRTSLDKLKSTGELTSKTTSQYRIIKLNKWNEYQIDDKQNDSQVTSERQASDKQATTNKNDKKEKNVKKKELVFNFSDQQINSLEFQQAWGMWVEHRKQIKKPLTQNAVSLQLIKLDKVGNKTAIEMMGQSIQNGWTGLFEVKQAQQKQETDMSQFSHLFD